MATLALPKPARNRPRSMDVFAAAGWHSTTYSPRYCVSPTPSRQLALPSPTADPRYSTRGLVESAAGYYDIEGQAPPSLSNFSLQRSDTDTPDPLEPAALWSARYGDDDKEKDDGQVWSDEEVTNTSDGNRDSQVPPWVPPPSSGFTFREALFIFNVCLAQFLSLSGLAQTFTPLSILSQSFGVTNPGILAWPTAAYSLTLGSCILPSGRLGDMYGHRRIFMIGWAWFAISSVASGFTKYGNIQALTACRAFQGIGPALLIPNGLALFGRTFPMGFKRNIAISMFGGSGPLGVVSGAVMTSLLAQLVQWSWCFFAMGIAAALICILSYIIIPQDDVRRPSQAGFETEKPPFDYEGAITGVGGLVLINWALNQAPIVGWQTPYIGILLGGGVLFMVAFVHVELKVARQPLVPLKGLHRDAGLTLACVAAGWGSHGIWSYYMFLLLEELRDHTPLLSCTQFWPVAPIGLVAALAVGFLLKRTKVANLLSIAMLCFLLGCLFLATAPAEQGYFPNTFLSVIITPFGMNWSFPTAVILMSNAVSKEHQGIAASLVSTTVNYSISTGLGFAGSINRYVTPEHGQLAGYRGAWYFGIGLASVGFLTSLYFVWQSGTKRK